MNFKVPEDFVFHFLRQTLICVYAIELYGKIALVCTVLSRSSSTPSYANFHNVSKLTFCIWTLYKWLSCFLLSIICICNYLVPCLSGDLYNWFFWDCAGSSLSVILFLFLDVHFPAMLILFWWWWWFWKERKSEANKKKEQFFAEWSSRRMSKRQS